MPQATNIGAIVAGLAAAALVLDVVTVTAVDGTAQVPDNVMLRVGILCTLLTLVLLAREVSRRSHHPVGYAVLVFLVSFGVVIALGHAGNAVSERFYRDDIVGLDVKWGVFCIGLAMFGVCGWFLSRAARTTPPL